MVYTSRFPIFAVTADVVCLAGEDEQRHVLLIERGGEPFRGRLALPGGFVDLDEDLEHAARRELLEETGVVAPERLPQVAAYGTPGRDPRGRTVSVVFLAVLGDRADARGGDDAVAAGWLPVDRVLAEPDRLAFDHGRIITDALRGG